MEQLRYLAGQRDVTFVQRQGDQMSLDKAKMGINDMLRYRETVILDHEAAARDVDLLRADDITLSRAIDALYEDIRRVQDDRAQIARQLKDIENLYDNQHREQNRQLSEVHYRFRHSKRRMGGKVVYKALEKMLKLHLKGYFDDMVYHHKYENMQIQSIIAFRNICLNYEQKRQRMYI